MFAMKHPVVDIAIICSNFKESLHFYRDLLGLEVVQDLTIPVETARGAGLAPREFRQVRLRAGETLIKLVEIEDAPRARTLDFQAGIRWLTFIVEDVPGTVTALTGKGVHFVAEPVAAPDARFVVCAEGPDGVLLEFVQV